MEKLQCLSGILSSKADRKIEGAAGDVAVGVFDIEIEGTTGDIAIRVFDIEIEVAAG
jgi:hypothetical protein